MRLRQLHSNSFLGLNQDHKSLSHNFVSSPFWRSLEIGFDPILVIFRCSCPPSTSLRPWNSGAHQCDPTHKKPRVLDDLTRNLYAQEKNKIARSWRYKNRDGTPCSLSRFRVICGRLQHNSTNRHITAIGGIGQYSIRAIEGISGIQLVFTVPPFESGRVKVPISASYDAWFHCQRQSRYEEPALHSPLI